MACKELRIFFFSSSSFGKENFLLTEVLTPRTFGRKDLHLKLGKLKNLHEKARRNREEAERSMGSQMRVTFR